MDRTTVGTLLFDAFESRRSTYIGPVTGQLLVRSITYDYDPLSRLTAADYDDGTFFHYTYDPVGNRLTEVTQAGTTNYAYDIANRLTSVDGVTYAWDPRSNMLSDGVSTYSYDRANRLTTVVQGANTYTFGYNGLGDRLRQTVNSAPTDFSLDLVSGLSQILSEASNTYLYGPDSSTGQAFRIGEEQAAGWEYHLGDALQSLRQLVNAGVEVDLARSYSPFGSTLVSTGTAISRFEFTGEQRDGTGLLFLRARYYSSELGRFITFDPTLPDPLVVEAQNPFAYAANSPATYVDPGGFQVGVEQILRALKRTAETCYGEGDLECVWRAYYALALGGRVLLYNHASDHLFRFLRKQGDILYHPYRSSSAPSTSDWVRFAPSVGKEVPLVNGDMLFRIHSRARAGGLIGSVRAADRPVQPDKASERDLYFAMNGFSLWAWAAFEVEGCYQVIVSPTYWFSDGYDWHPGLPAGGAVPGLADFKDEWAAALHDSGLAMEYEITGYWMGPVREYTFPSNWLDKEIPPPPLTSRVVWR